MIINIDVTPRGNEPLDKMLRRFLRKCKKEEIVSEVFDRLYFKSQKQKRKEKSLKRQKYLQKKKRN